MLWRAFPLCLVLSLPVDAQCSGTEPIESPIPAIQGRGEISPCANRLVTTTGVITASFSHLNGFFLQDISGDSDGSTSDGIFVFQGSGSPLPAAGAFARVTGRVAEFARQGNPGTVTEIDVRRSVTAGANVEILGTGMTPAAAGLNNDYEVLEGMIVFYPRSVAMGPANTFGETWTMRFEGLPPTIRLVQRDWMDRPVMVGRGAGLPQQLKAFDLLPPFIGVVHFQIGGKEPERVRSGEFLALQLASISDAIVLGDFNDSEYALSLDALERAGLQNVSWRTAEHLRYTLNFEGRSQAFDHIFLKGSFTVIASGFAHYNADFPAALRDLDATPLRSADHDNPYAYLQ